MLSFSPNDRISINDAISHNYHTSVRNESCESISRHPMSSDIETVGESGKNLLINVIKEVLAYRS